MKLRVLILAGFAAIPMLLTACSPVKFSGADVSVLGPNNPAVCDPFGGGTATPGHGLVAELHYLTQDQYSNPPTNFAGMYNTAKGNLSKPLFLNDLNVPTRYFVSGMKDTNGNLVTMSDGTTPLTEYFSYHATSTFVTGNWAPGDYQISILTDDGANLTIKGAGPNGEDLVINNDGTHSTKMGCTSTYMHVGANSKFDMTFDYYQGPRVSIAFLMLARPLPPGNSLDPQCGLGASSDTYFFDDHGYPNPPVPSQNYTDLVNRGWTPVDGSHFVLPASQQNPCVTTSP